MEPSKQQGLNELFPNFVLSKSFPACKVYGRVKIRGEAEGGTVPTLGQLWDNSTHMHIHNYKWSHDTLLIAN